MEYRFRYEQGTLYAFAKGELDMNTADAWRHAIDQELNETCARHLVFDFHQVTFIDSSGLGVILGRYRRLAAWGGKVYIRGANPQVYRILYLSGFHRVMEMEKPEERQQAGGETI